MFNERRHETMWEKKKKQASKKNKELKNTICRGRMMIQLSASMLGS
jgi:hypothetical protein